MCTLGLSSSFEIRKNQFAGLEQQAISAMRSGDYQFAEKIYRLILDDVREIQEKDNTRIHKGGYYHQLGFILLLEGRLLDSMRSFFLAYIEDTLNVPLGQEDAADTAPAARVLKNGFHLTDETFKATKSISKASRAGSVVKTPEVILSKVLAAKRINEGGLLSLCNPIPNADEVRRQLFVNLSPQAEKTLNGMMNERMQRVVELAAFIARESGHNVVTEEDIKTAIKKLDGQGT